MGYVAADAKVDLTSARAAREARDRMLYVGRARPAPEKNERTRDRSGRSRRSRDTPTK